MMGFALHLLLWSCVINAFLPNLALGLKLPQKESTEPNKNITYATVTKRVYAKTTSQWSCPHITDVTGISCTCDVPHTIRCRGQAPNPQILRVLTKKLSAVSNTEKSISLLDLSIHEIGTIPRASFKGLQLMGLVISTAGLQDLKADAFEGIEHDLAALGLPGNKMVTVPTAAVRRLMSLRWLDLSDNNMNTISTHEFPTMMLLDNLNLAGNGMRTIEIEAFAGLPQLTVLNLARNQLDFTQLNERSLWGLHYLSELSLQSNLLKGTLSPTFLSSVPTLVSLDLSHNSLTKVTLSVLSGCEKLVNLDLSHNQIDIIEDHAFKHLSKLQRLELSHNNIVAVSGWSLAHLANLLRLSIADNFLLAVTADLLHQLPSLTSLDVASNDITILQPDVFNYTPSLTHMDLSDNPLHCDCSLSWLWTWINSHQLISNEDKRSAVCVTPPSFENAPLNELKFADLVCLKDMSDYYHDAAIDYDESTEIRVSEAEIILQGASWVEDGVQLVWNVDPKAVPYTCQSIHIYEMKRIDGIMHQILTDSLDVNCSSDDQLFPHRVVVIVPASILNPGSMYRYCLVLIERGTGDDEGFLPGCSEALHLSAQPLGTGQDVDKSLSVTSLTAGAMGMDLVVQTKFNHQLWPCSYSLYVVRSSSIQAFRQLNCTQARHAFPSLVSGEYIVCVTPNLANRHQGKDDLQNKLDSSKNSSETLLSIFPACTTVILREHSSNKITAPLITLLFTLPGLALLITIYIIGRRVWKGGGIPWKWDPRANKRAKYFLYTGEAASPNVSLDPLPAGSPEFTTRV